MKLKIVKSTEKIEVRSIKILLYGEPGIGKTSLALTAEKALCLDFDSGIHRAIRNADALEIESFDSILELLHSDEGVKILRDYKTLVVDTAGTLLSYITEHIRANETKTYGANRPGMFFNARSNSLTLQGFGVLKSVFKNFLDTILLLHKDIVFIAHETTEKNGDNIKKIPAVSGGSYDLLLQNMDLIGYMFFEGERIVDFTPNSTHYGKDCANLGKILIPNPLPSNYLSLKIQKAKEVLGGKILHTEKILQKIEEYLSKIDQIQTPEDATFLLQQIWVDETAVQKATRKALIDKAKALNFGYDKSTNTFYYAHNKD